MDKKSHCRGKKKKGERGRPPEDKIFSQEMKPKIEHSESYCVDVGRLGRGTCRLRTSAYRLVRLSSVTCAPYNFDKEADTPDSLALRHSLAKARNGALTKVLNDMSCGFCRGCSSQTGKKTTSVARTAQWGHNGS